MSFDLSGILYQRRFELFFASLVAILFGSLVVPEDVYEEYLSTGLFLFNIVCGMNLIRSKRRLYFFFLGLFALILLVLPVIRFLVPGFNVEVKYGEWFVYLLFYIAVTYQLIWQVWVAKDVSKNVIFGLMSGYMSLGLIAYLVFRMISLSTPGAFHLPGAEETSTLMYYSYITILTIGYGDIYPVDPLAQKVAVLVGLAGQFYLVIIMAVVLEKYIRQSRD